MSSKNPPPKTPFDNLVSSTQLDMMKLLIPFMPPASQSLFALFIKFQELQETIRFFRLFPEGIRSENDNSNSNGAPDFISIIKPYLPEENLEMFDTISNMMNMMEMIKQMQAMSETTGEDNSMDFLKNMLSPEQQAMFDVMNQMYDSGEESTDNPNDSTNNSNS